MTLSLGKMRHLQQISSSKGIFTILAVDHREPMLQMLQERDGKKPTRHQVIKEKQQLVQALAPYTSGVLLDPIYSVQPIIYHHILPKEVGLLVAREKSGYREQTNRSRDTLLLPDWPAKMIKQIGGGAVKLLLYYHPQAANAHCQEDIVRQVAKECTESDILFMLEPICYPLEDISPLEFAKQKPKIILDSAQKLVPLGVDILKAEFPGDMVYQKEEKQIRNDCRKLTDSIDIPWVLLSAGVDFAQFQYQVEIACEEGASGFVAGRAIWKEAIFSPSNKREHSLCNIAVSRLKILSAIADHLGSSWQKRLASRFPKLEGQ